MAKQIHNDTKFVGTRLPTTVKPVHYDLCLKPNFEDFTYTGEVKISYESSNAGDLSKNIVLNVVDLEILDGSLGSNPLTSVTYGKSSETATLEFQDNIAPQGAVTLSFKGTLNDKMKGFYRTTYKVDGEAIVAAATQFEATDARRCFPCWDEPAVKATFSVTMIVNKFMTINGKQYERTVLSNMPEIGREGPDTETKIKFDKTPIMSTYLLAFVVGPFDMIEVMNKNRPVRVYTTPGNKERGRYALGVATKSLSYYEEYFGIDYPLPKMDLIAVPDFASGAMENWGLITYRETCLLVDPQKTSTRLRQWVALVVAHEIAHQWFGNLVTMEWWTHLWLNEGFASFMEFLCVHHIHPEFDIMSQFVTDSHNRALELDSLHSSHPIEVPVNDPSEIDEIFDDISYAKGSTVIRMMYEYIGDEYFRKGMKDYLSKFAYKNACTEDLWDSLEKASNKPVRALMSGWTSQMGYPWLDVKVGGSKLNVTQSKFTSDGILSADEAKASWMVPLSAVSGKNPGKVSELCLLSDKTKDVEIPDIGDSWFKLNPGCIGLYRVAYPSEMRSKLFEAVANKSLPPMDRLNLHNDLYALCRAGKASTVDLMQLLMSSKAEDDYTVWSAIDLSVAKIKLLIGESEVKDKFNAFCRQVYGDIFKKLTWEARQGENNEGMTRSLVINRLITSGDEILIEEAKNRFKKHLDGFELAADLRAPVYKAIATYGDDDSFEGLFEIHRKSDLSEEKNRAAMGLASTKIPERLKRVIEFAMSPEVKNQDKPSVIFPIGANNPEVSFKILRDNKAFFQEKYETGHLMTRLIKCSIENFITEEKAREVEEYFKENKFPGAERTIKQALENIRLNASWLGRDGDAIKSFLSSY